MNPIALIALYLGVTLLPLMLSWISARPPRTFWDELASGAGMLAFAIILIEFVLSGRYRKISQRIGMDITMRFHQLFARTALALAVIHPFLYRTHFNPQYPWDVTRHDSLTFEISSLGSGIAAWILLPVLVLLAIGRDKLGYRYEIWRMMHAFGALLIAGMLLHHTLSAGRYAQDPALAGVWILLSLTALLSLVYVYAIEPFRQKALPWTVSSVRPLALKTWELTLAPKGHAGLDYSAGQFVWLNVGGSPFSVNENPFSISSAPASGEKLQFMIKELGDFTSTVGQIEPGTTAYINGPHGNLTLLDRKEPGIALIAGGVGLAPLLAILRQLHLTKDNRPNILIYGNRIEEQIAYREELEQLGEDQKTKIVHVISEPTETWVGETGIADIKILRSALTPAQIKQWLFVLCGPPRMMENVESTLIDLGASPDRIISERFKYD